MPATDHEREKKKLYVLVEAWNGVVVDVHVFKYYKNAKEWFFLYTGKRYTKNVYKHLDAELDQTKIFEVAIDNCRLSSAKWV